MDLRIGKLCFIYMVVGTILIFFPVMETQPGAYDAEDINLSLPYIIPLILGFFIICVENFLYKNIVKRKRIIRKTSIFMIFLISIITVFNLFQYNGNMYYWLLAPAGQMMMYCHILIRVKSRLSRE